jgi:hypothetical protein
MKPCPASVEVAMTHWLPKVKVSPLEAPCHGVAIGGLSAGFSNVDSNGDIHVTVGQPGGIGGYSQIKLDGYARDFAAQAFMMQALTRDEAGNNHLLLTVNAHTALAVGSNIALMGGARSKCVGKWRSCNVDWKYPFAGSEKNLTLLGGTVDDIAVCIIPHNWASELGIQPVKASNLSFEQSGPITFYTHNALGTWAHSGTFVDGGTGVDGVLSHNCSTGKGDSGAIGYHASKFAALHFGGLPGAYNLAINAATILQLMRMCHVVPTPKFLRRRASSTKQNTSNLSPAR